MSAIQIDNENAICEVTNIHFLQFHELEIKTFCAIQRSDNGIPQLFSGTILHGKDSNNILFWM